MYNSPNEECINQYVLQNTNMQKWAVWTSSTVEIPFLGFILFKMHRTHVRKLYHAGNSRSLLWKFCLCLNLERGTLCHFLFL